jgi:uncharacterized membrane protein SpoIIM required for sporulation/uncharacterized RDD family membrane protein YckC
LPTPLARTVEIETPEQVAVGFELADLGSRFLALVLDGLILLVSALGLFAGALWVLSTVDLPAAVGGWGLAALTILTFVVLWGYFVWFEGLREGQTPGKKRVGLRVVHDGGYPLTIRGAAVRNLVRIVDLQPAFTCLAGGFVMMLHPQTKRLGDIAAGTIVVRDRGGGRLPEDETVKRVQAGPPLLSDAEFTALERFVARQGSLEPGARARVARGLADVLGDRLPSGETRTLTERLAMLHAAEASRRAAIAGHSGLGTRQSAALVAARRARWAEYEHLLSVAQRKGLSALGENDVSRFAELYRLLSADLARVRTYGGSGELVYALERWVAAGHNVFYRPEQRTWHALRQWLVRGFPTLVRKRWPPIAVAAAALFLPAIVAYVTIRSSPPIARDLLPATIVARAEQATERAQTGQGYVDVPEVFMPVMSSSIIANNIQVTFLAFAGGILAGFGTLALLFFNGVHLGAIVGLYDANGAGALIWTFVAPHGVIELTAACIAGGAGVWMGSGLVLPGRSTRIHALTTRAREAVSLLAGTTALLIVAGLIEGFISPAPFSIGAKLAVAAVAALACFAYLLGAGRETGADPPAPDDQINPRYFTSR